MRIWFWQSPRLLLQRPTMIATVAVPFRHWLQTTDSVPLESWDRTLADSLRVKNETVEQKGFSHPFSTPCFSASPPHLDACIMHELCCNKIELMLSWWILVAKGMITRQIILSIPYLQTWNWKRCGGRLFIMENALQYASTQFSVGKRKCLLQSRMTDEFPRFQAAKTTHTPHNSNNSNINNNSSSNNRNSSNSPPPPHCCRCHHKTTPEGHEFESLKMQFEKMFNKILVTDGRYFKI